MNYNYESHTWGSHIIPHTLDYPRLKYNLLISQIKHFNPKAILEIGCGSGKFIFTLNKDLPNCSFKGIDISHKAISEAQLVNSHQNINFFVMNAEKINFENENFDIIIIMDVLEHLNNPEKIIKEANRLLIKGGVLYVFSPCEAHSIYWLSEKILGFHIKMITAGHIQRFTRNCVSDLISDKFNIVDKKFSFHLLGSLMDYTLFTLLLNKNIAKKFWSDNKFYNKNVKPKISTRIMNFFFSLGSMFAYFESLLFLNVPLLATGIHITAVKK